MPQTSILVIEDEPLIRMAVADDLRDAGFHTLEAANAEDALEILAAEASIAAIFTDIDLHGKVDGLKLAWTVQDRWPDVKIIITSGKRRIERTEAPDSSLFLPKPYTHQAVIEAIRRVIS